MNRRNFIKAVGAAIALMVSGCKDPFIKIANGKPKYPNRLLTLMPMSDGKPAITDFHRESAMYCAREAMRRSGFNPDLVGSVVPDLGNVLHMDEIGECGVKWRLIGNDGLPL